MNLWDQIFNDPRVRGPLEAEKKQQVPPESGWEAHDVPVAVTRASSTPTTGALALAPGLDPHDLKENISQWVIMGTGRNLQLNPL